MSLHPNPSHLEAINSVVLGSAKAMQDDSNDTLGRSVVPVLVHGDAAFAGLGVVTEALNLSQISGYSCGGTVHMIINNQIGFTTDPARARSTLHPTDIARSIGAPIFHVNGDDVEAVVRASQMAFEFRQRFGEDAVVDIVCYRCSY